jgi:hypothetical protein
MPDTESEGLTDGDEVNIWGSDPNEDDSDGDGVDDGTEAGDGTDPNDPTIRDVGAGWAAYAHARCDRPGTSSGRSPSARPNRCARSRFVRRA